MRIKQAQRQTVYAVMKVEWDKHHVATDPMRQLHHTTASPRLLTKRT